MIAGCAVEVDHFGGARGTDGWGSDESRVVTPTGAPSGFDAAFGDLYQLAYRVAYRILGDRGDAEDVAQEALARASIRWSRLEDRPEGWVSRVASNLAIDRFRRRRREFPSATGPLGLVDPLLGERDDLVRALRGLPRRQREVVVLRYLADMSEADVARNLGCSTGTVKSHGARGLSALRRQLTDPSLQEGDDARAS
jgi:RNA polymerase sigma-70 factor (sigma-E family)